MQRLRNLVQRSIDSGLTQQDLAQQIGVSQGTISNVLRGHTPNKMDKLERFASYYRVTVEELTGHGYPARGAKIPDRDGTDRLIALLDQLKDDELETLTRCAEAFASHIPDVKVHLVNQLKLIERLIGHEHMKPPRRRTGTEHP